MLCPRCNSRNPEGARFCMQCGTALELASYTPKHLQERVLSTRGALEGERKQVTVMFVDVKDSVALSARVGPDVWHEILDALFPALSAEIHRFGGTVNQYTGDGVMALFSAPIAHENHAEQACRAALAAQAAVARLNRQMRASHGVQLQLRIGLNSGDVVVGRIGDDLRMDYTAQGETVGLAARMEALCEPGGVLLSEQTAQLLPPGFSLRGPEPFEVKGAGLVNGYALVEIDDRMQRSVAPRHPGAAPLLGRARELDALRNALETAFHGHGCVAAIRGEAGMGKSRLGWELLAECSARNIPSHATRCVSEVRRQPFSALAPLLLGLLGAREGDAVEATRAQVASTLRVRFGALGEELSPLFFTALDLERGLQARTPIDPEARQRRFQQAVLSLIETSGPALLLLDDAHLIDAASEELLTAIVPILPRSHVLLVVTGRNEYAPDWLDDPACTSLPLAPLGPDEVDALLVQWAGRDPSLSHVFELIQARARGNPLFVEESVRSLVEQMALSGTRGDYRVQTAPSALAVPATVQSILAARIDRLADADKRVLQAAAALGQDLDAEQLRTVLELEPEAFERALQSLRRSEFVFTPPRGPENRIEFRHPLLREVAYGALLLQQRRRLHARIAAVLASPGPYARASDAANVAHHLELAGDPVRAADLYRRAAKLAGYADTEQSYAYYEKVAELARQRSDLSEANRYELTACMQLLNLGWRRGLDRATSDRVFRRGLELALQANNVVARATLHAGYGRALSALDGTESSIDHAREALRVARETSDASFIASMSAAYAQALFRRGELRDGVDACNEALELASMQASARNRGLDFSVESWVWLLRGHGLLLLGRLDDAQRDLEACLRAATERNEIDLLVAPRMHLVDVSYYRGESMGTARLAREAMELADKLGNSLARINARTALGTAALAAGDAPAAEDSFRAAIRIATERSAGMEFAPRLHVQLAQALSRQGRAKEAQDTIGQALEEARRLHSRVSEAQALLVGVEIELLAPWPAGMVELEQALERAEQLMDQTGARILQPQLLLARASVAERRGAMQGS
ncbi:MAG: adenylate/guanylate cyclase domain-containing protein [Polyangiales bacterium]